MIRRNKNRLPHMCTFQMPQRLLLLFKRVQCWGVFANKKERSGYKRRLMPLQYLMASQPPLFAVIWSLD